MPLDCPGRKRERTSLDRLGRRRGASKPLFPEAQNRTIDLSRFTPTTETVERLSSTNRETTF
jgi:hypothetical protein